MSLDISLVTTYDTGHGPTEIEVFESNITHNLTGMADALDIYGVVWRPEENDVETAEQLIEPLESALKRLKGRPDLFADLEADNGWGTIKQFTPWLEELLAACRAHPLAGVKSFR
jgi:hypothetical protein